MHMQYCIKLDVGKAMSAFLVRWQMEEEFKNTIIHLGDFTFLKENCKTLGIMVKNSGFQDVVFCSGVCTYGSLTLNGTLACSHYNCAWKINYIFRGLRKVSRYERFRHENKHCA